MIGLSITGCALDNMQKTPIENFIGTWELEGRKMFEGIKIEIYKNKSAKLEAKVVQLNNNKYIKMFVEQNDIWIKEIKRASNFKFKLTEKKIGNALFSIYGQKTTKEYKIEFIDKNTFGLATKNSDPQKSKVRYKRVKN